MIPGIDPERRYSAREMLDLMAGPSIYKLPLETIATRSDGTHITVPAYAIVRSAYGSHHTEATLGIVREGYNLVTPEQVAEMWDERVGKHIETAAYLRDAKLFLLTCKLEPFAIKDDTMQTYLGLHTWMDGVTASTALVSFVREVCMNTVNMAHEQAEQKVRFNHDRWILDRMGRWMADVIDVAEHGLPALKEAMNALADYRLQSPRQEVMHVLGAAYPTPQKPTFDALVGKDLNDLRMNKWEAEARLITERRRAALELFKGRGTGMDSKAAAGTAWGLYNAVVEVEDWRGGAKGKDSDARAAAILVGERAEAKQRAFDACMQVVKQEVSV